MNRKSIYYKSKINIIITSVIILCGVIISMLMALNILKIKDSYPAVNSARLVTKDALDNIEDNFTGKNFNSLDKFNFKIKVLDLKGNILYNSYDNKSGVEDIASSIGYDMNFSSLNDGLIKYSSPVIVNGMQVGNSVFYIKKGMLFKNNDTWDMLIIFLPTLISFLIVLCRELYSIHTIKNEFVKPVAELNISADAIIKGDFNKKIIYNSNTEIGKFCASFEMMRDELKDSIERERRLEDSRKELITCISHDLRTPIASIKAYSDGILDGVAKDPDSIKRYLNVISKKTEVLTKLINDLFEHCQIELNKLSINKTEIYSGEFLKSIAYELSLEFENSTQQFEALDMPNVLINIDKLRIEQVIYNLIQNAKKYTPPDGKIVFGAEIEDDYLKIFVKDNGYGIKSEDIPFIFDKFYRGEKARSTDKGGSGLGLSICKYIVENHGGQIFVESGSSGSNFYFVIPKV